MREEGVSSAFSLLPSSSEVPHQVHTSKCPDALLLAPQEVREWAGEAGDRGPPPPRCCHLTDLGWGFGPGPQLFSISLGAAEPRTLDFIPTLAS